MEPGEIERVLCGHDAVAACCIKPELAQNGECQLIAYVATGDARVSIEELREYLRARLPEYMVPAMFALLERLPVTPNGKVDRKALIMPGDDSHGHRSGEWKPAEQIIANVWADVLRAQVSSTSDSFFELGGHSLIATRVMHRLQGIFGVDVPLKMIFDNPTVAGLASAMERAQQSRLASPPLVPRQSSGPAPLSFSQQRLWFLEKLHPGQSTYNCPVYLKLMGNLSVPALEHSLNELVHRHEVLRTRFVEPGGGRFRWWMLQRSRLSVSLISRRSILSRKKSSFKPSLIWMRTPPFT